MTSICPKGHASTEADYCSECGARIDAPGIVAQLTAAPAATVNAGNGNDCPDCGTVRSNGARFCEVCRHDFQTGTTTRPDALLSAAVVTAPTIPAPGAAPIASATGNVASGINTSTANFTPIAAPALKLSVVVTVDPTLVTEPDPDSPCPANAPERVFPLDLAENLVGRRSESKDSHPEIPVSDPGISRRHMKFLRQADGSFQVADLGSANGIIFNGTALEAGVQKTIAPGDTITLGMWTRLTIRAR